MTDEPTGDELIPEEIAAQEEQKNQNQEEAFKRITEENKKLKEEKEEREKSEGEENKKTDDKNKKKESPDVRTIIREELNAKTESENKIKEIFTKYPELKEFEPKIKEYLADETRKDIPLDEIITGAVGMEKLLQIGATMGSERLKITEDSKTGGGNANVNIQTEEEKTEKKHMESLPDEFK